MMLAHMGFSDAARIVENAVKAVIADKTVTPDLAVGMTGARAVSCSEFGRLLAAKI